MTDNKGNTSPDKDKGTDVSSPVREGDLPRELALITPVDLQRVISNVIMTRRLTKTHFLTAEPNPIRTIKFNLSGMTLEKMFTKACGQGVVEVAHATDPKTDPPKMEMPLFREWKKSCNGIYEVFISQAGRKPKVITKETVQADLQAAIAAALATGMTEDEINTVVNA